MANNDWWRIYGNTIANDRGEMIFELGDNAQASSAIGQRFRFFYNNVADGTAKSPFILDYNDAVFNTNASFIGSVGIGTASPDQRLTVDGNVRAGGVGNGFLLDTTGVNFTNGMKVVNSFETAVFSGRGSAGYVIVGDNNLRFGFGVNYSAGESMRITSGGNVGIGTTSPSARLEIREANRVFDGYGNVNVFTVDLGSQNVGGSIALGGDSFGGTSPYTFAKIQGIKEGGGAWTGALILGTTQSNSAVTEKMRITSGGNVGIGTTSPNQLLHIEKDQNTYTNLRIRNNDTGSSAYTMIGLNSSGNSWGIRMGSANANSNRLDFVIDAFVSPVVRMSITSGGLIVSPPTFNATSSTAANMTIAGDGTIYRSTSSLKYKKNVQDYTKGLNEIMQMRPVSYNSKNETEQGILFAGLIAEEIDELGMNEFVQYAADGTPDALSYSNMIALLVNGIKELKAEIEILKNK
jgi:hypothetical protein